MSELHWLSRFEPELCGHWASVCLPGYRWCTPGRGEVGHEAAPYRPSGSFAGSSASPHYVDSEQESLVFWLSLGSAGYVGSTRINWIWAGVPGRGRGGGRALLARGGEGWGGPLPARHAHYRVTCPPREGGTWVVLVTSTQLVPMKISSCRSSFE